MEGNLEKFETRDLCIVSKLEIPAFVMRHGNGSIVADGNDVQSVYSLDDFRYVNSILVLILRGTSASEVYILILYSLLRVAPCAMH